MTACTITELWLSKAIKNTSYVQRDSCNNLTESKHLSDFFPYFNEYADHRIYDHYNLKELAV